MSNVIVSKFGGASMSTVEMIKRTADIILSDPARRYVVVSAPGKRTKEDIRMTDLLYLCHSRYSSRENFNEILTNIQARYDEIIKGLDITFDIGAEIVSIKKNLFFNTDNNYVVSRGEYIMAKIMAAYLNWPFIDAGSILFFNRDGTPNIDKTYSTTAEVLKGVDHAVIPGFYGSLPGGGIKTFPRGGGDTTAAVLTRAVRADLYEKWAESSDIYSADPAIVDNPAIIRNITYGELMELNYMGIKIVHEDVILMLRGMGIPLKIRNINHPEDEGTLVTPELPEGLSRHVAACIAGQRKFKVIHIEKFGLNKTVGIGQKMFGIFTKRNISCEHYMSGIYQFSIVVKNPLFDLKRKEIIEEIHNTINPQSVTVGKDLSIIAVIGKGMGTVKGIFARVFDAIAAAGIKVRMIVQGADDLNIILGFDDEDFDNAVRALYKAMIVD